MFDHFAPEQRILDARVYEQGLAMKPKGLWFSPSGDEVSWEGFCTAEQFALDRLEYKHTFALDMSNILHIDTDEGIDAFAAAYKANGEISAHIGGSYAHHIWEIDWPRVSTEFKGILIQPYSWKKRLSEHMWYYGWDCSSGCVWDITAIKNWNPTIPVSELTYLGKF